MPNPDLQARDALPFALKSIETSTLTRERAKRDQAKHEWMW